jgi:uncharacterized protein (UPF0276 family)
MSAAAGLLENGSFFMPVPDIDMNEPAFLNRLYVEGYCGTLHNFYVTGRNGGMSPEDYLEELDPDAAEEIHLAGGDEFAGFYTTLIMIATGVLRSFVILQIPTRSTSSRVTSSARRS